MYQVCSKCKIEKSFSNFQYCKLGKNNLRQDCKACRKLYRESRKAQIKEYHRLRYIEKKEIIDTRNKAWVKNANKDLEYKNKISLKNKKWKIENKDYVRLSKRLSYHRLKQDPLWRLRLRIRNRTKDAIRRSLFNKNSKKNSFPNYIGCTKEQLFKYIEDQFTLGMNWDKFLKAEIHIDHIIPLCTAKTEEDIYKLSHFSNLQPLWAVDNLKKGAKIG